MMLRNVKNSAKLHQSPFMDEQAGRSKIWSICQRANCGGKYERSWLITISQIGLGDHFVSLGNCGDPSQIGDN